MSKPTKFWDGIAKRYSEKPVADEAAYHKKLAVTRNYFHTDMEVLEFGCGTGSTAIAHAPYVKHILATDISSKMIEIAQAKAGADNVKNVTFKQTAIDGFSVADQTFDTVMGHSILHLVDDKDGIISRVYMMLKPGGVFVSNTACLGDRMIVSGFAKLIAEDVLGYIGGNWKSGAKKSDLETIAGLVRGVANDSGGTATIETVEYREGVSSRELVLKFDTSEARTAVQILQDHKLDLDKTSAADYERVLMTFTRSDIGDASVGKRTGEWALIEEILEKPRPLIYASDLAEQKIKYEIREADDNIFKKAFSVDVNVQTRNGRPVAYAVTHVHQVIDLPDD